MYALAAGPNATNITPQKCYKLRSHVQNISLMETSSKINFTSFCFSSNELFSIRKLKRFNPFSIDIKSITLRTYNRDLSALRVTILVVPMAIDGCLRWIVLIELNGCISFALKWTKSDNQLSTIHRPWYLTDLESFQENIW